MSLREPFNTRLHELLCQLSDSEPTPELLCEIEALVLSSPQTKQQYLGYVQLESAAQQLLAGSQFEHAIQLSPASKELDATEEAPVPLLLFPADESPVVAENEPSSPVSPQFTVAGRSSRRWLYAFAGSTAVLVIGVLWNVLRSDREPTFSEGGRHGAVATLIGTQHCRWINGDSNSSPGPGARLPVGRLNLAEGLAELVFDCGAQVILEGPAEFELTGAKSATAWRGRLVAKVPPEAIGFTVVTPDATIVDYGTEFALAVERSKATEVHVIAGKVEVESVGASPGSARKALRTGQAVRLDRTSRGLPEVVELADNRFVRNVRFGYGLYPASLISYWSFDETLEGSRAIDRAGSNHGSFEGAVQRVEGLVGDGAAMFTNGEGDLINVGPDFSFTTGITIEALIACTWNGQFDPQAGVDVYPDGGNYDEIFRKEDGGQRVLLSFQNDRKSFKTIPVVPPGPVLAFGLNVGGEYSELDMPLDGLEGRPIVPEICDGKTHYVAAVYDSATGEKAIYIDGRKRFSAQFPPGTLIESGGNVSAGIGGWYTEWANGDSFAAEPFSGVIDEVAVYRSALSESDIAKHYRRVLEGGSYFSDAKPGLEPSSTKSRASVQSVESR